MVITSLFIMLVLVSSYLIIIIIIIYIYIYIFFFIGARRPHLSRFYIERVQKACLCTDRTFHFLVSLQRLATWGLSPEPSTEAIAHELTIRSRKFFYHFSFPFPLFFVFFFNNAFPFQEWLQ